MASLTIARLLVSMPSKMPWSSSLRTSAVREATGASFELALSRLEDLYQHELMATEDAQEGLKAFAEKRQPVWANR